MMDAYRSAELPRCTTGTANVVPVQVPMAEELAPKGSRGRATREEEAGTAREQHAEQSAEQPAEDQSAMAFDQPADWQDPAARLARSVWDRWVG